MRPAGTRPGLAAGRSPAAPAEGARLAAAANWPLLLATRPPPARTTRALPLPAARQLISRRETAAPGDVSCRPLSLKEVSRGSRSRRRHKADRKGAFSRDQTHPPARVSGDQVAAMARERINAAGGRRRRRSVSPAAPSRAQWQKLPRLPFCSHHRAVAGTHRTGRSASAHLSAPLNYHCNISPCGSYVSPCRRRFLSWFIP